MISMDGFAKSLPQLCQSMIKTAANAITCMDMDENGCQEIISDLRDNLEKYSKNTEMYKKMNEMSNEILSQPEQNRKELLNKFCENINSFDPDIVNSEYIKEYDDRVAALMKISKAQDNTPNDGELQITQVNNVNLICPISKSRMTEPMKNTICGHIYDKSSVISLLKMAKHTRCPIVGCSNKEYLDLKHLKSDIVTQMYVEAIDD